MAGDGMAAVWRKRWTAGAVAAALMAAGAAFGAETQPAKKFATLDQWAVARCKAVLDQAEKDGDFAAANNAAMKVLETLAAFGTEKNAAGFRDAAMTWRLMAVFEEVEGREELLKFLRKHPKFTHALAFLVTSTDDAEGMANVIAKLREKHEKDLENFATLAAAICVVHDKPLKRRVNENIPEAIDPVAIFEYFSANEKQMYFGIRNVPAELLIWVVDTTSTTAELKWALNNYHHNNEVGQLFFTIKYDDDAFAKGTTKRVTEAGFNLPNILKYGGVCADQAYFAMEVGKAIGVPTAYASGASATTNHAWVGFLQAKGKQGWWNFNAGRYSAYKGVRGLVLDPQTRQNIPDNDVSLSAEMIGATDVDRETAVAFTDVAAHLFTLMQKEKQLEPETPETKYPDMRAKALTPSPETVLEFLDSSLKKNLGYARAWLTVGSLAGEGKMTLEQKKFWSNEIMKLCGAKYPDFAMGVLEPMIGTVKDVKEQNRLWEAAFKLFDQRMDLAAEVRMNQAAMWDENGDSNEAGKCYMDVVTRYADAGPFVLKALTGAESMLRSTGKEDKIVQLYSDTWKRTKEPKEMAGEFMVQSNWYRVGRMLARKLDDAGDKRGAEAVRQKLDATTKDAGK
jgi:hypothetical protein